MVRLSPITVLLTAALAAVGCANGRGHGSDTDDSDASDTDLVIASLSGRIGAAGGELVGEAGGPFAGVRLVVPAGALDGDTTVSITGVTDPTPLPEGAERVGPQFHLEPEGLTLAAPAELTVPFDPALRGLWPVSDEDCRVWYRDGDGWSRADAVRADVDGVTVSVSVLSNVGAGMLMSSLPPLNS